MKNLIAGIAIVLGTARLPQPSRTVVKAVIRDSYDQNMRDLYFDGILELLHLEQTNRELTDTEKLERLVGLDRDARSDHFLITVARTTEARALWAKLRDLALLYSKRTPQDAKFHERMRKAELTASDLGDLSLLHRVDTAGRDTLIALGGLYGAIALIKPEWSAKAAEFITDVMTVLPPEATASTVVGVGVASAAKQMWTHRKNRQAQILEDNVRLQELLAPLKKGELVIQDTD